MGLLWKSGKITPGKSGNRSGWWGRAEVRNKSGRKVAWFNVYNKVDYKPKRPRALGTNPRALGTNPRAIGAINNKPAKPHRRWLP